MTALETIPAPPIAVGVDELFDLQLRVARRADELARGHDPGFDRDLRCWMQAEREMLRLETAEPAGQR